MALGMAVEYFHTASLLFDDLPCMDDALERRGSVCAHLVHGEAAAILGALAFIARGYALLWDGIGELPEEARRRAASLVAECVGIGGVLDGQARDLHFGSSARSAADVLRVARGKTVSLIRLTLLLPAMASGAAADDEERLERLARCWGLAYQILDDFKDGLMSSAETGKSTHRDRRMARPNLPAAVGDEEALARLVELVGDAAGIVEDLCRDATEGDRWLALRPIQELLETGLGEIWKRLRAASSSPAVMRREGFPG